MEIEINSVIETEYLKQREHFKNNNRFNHPKDVPIDIQFMAAILTSYKTLWAGVQQEGGD